MLGTVLLAVLFGSVPLTSALFCFNENGTIELSGNCTDIVAVFGTVHPFQTSFNISGSEIDNRKAVLQIGIGSWTKNLTIWLNSTTDKTSWTFGREPRDGGLPLAVSLKFEAYDGLNTAAQKNIATVSIKDAEAKSKTMRIKESNGWRLKLFQRKTAQSEPIERLPIWFRILSGHLKIDALGESKIINVCKKESVVDCPEEPTRMLIADQSEYLSRATPPDPIGAHPEDLNSQPTPAQEEAFTTLTMVVVIVFVVCIVVPYSSSFCVSSVMTAGVASVLTQDESAQMPRSQTVSRSITRTLRLSRSRRSPLPPMPPLPPPPTTTSSNFLALTSSNPTNDEQKPKTTKSAKSKESIRKPKASFQTPKSKRSAEPSQSSELIFSTQNADSVTAQPTQHEGSIQHKTVGN